MNHAERLRQLADRMGLDGYAEELREIAGEMEAQPPAQAELGLIQAITDPENQPSQFGTVTLDFHFAKIKQWEEKFDRLFDIHRALQMAQAGQWQPIDTAPRDEPFLAVLLCGDHRMICTMRRAVADAKNSRPDGDGFHVERVAHWMPLPPPPATLKGQQ